MANLKEYYFHFGSLLITNMNLGTRSERLALYNAVRGTARAPQFFEVPSDAISDMEFDLLDLDRIPVGEPFAVIVTINVSGFEIGQLVI